MSTVSCPRNLFSVTLYRTKTNTNTWVTKTFYVKATSSSAAKNLTTNGTVGIVADPSRTLLEYSPDSLQYEQGMLGAVPDGGVVDSPVSAMEYLTGILTSKVYDVAIESPLQHATKLSEKLGVNVWLKREDAQPVFSFKLRGAYNMMAKLSKEKLEEGVICSSAGNHAQGVALAAKTLGCDAVIVMPVTTPQIKWESVKRLGATVVLEGDSYDEAQAYAKRRGVVENRTFIPPFDHPDVISGQGTVGMEIVRQMQTPIHAIFVPVGGGGLIAGIAAYVKRVSPQVKIIGVEPADANAMALSLQTVGVGTFRHMLGAGLSWMDMFEEKRSILEPAGALALAGAEAYCRFYNLKDENVVAITSGANMNFDRLRLVTELANIGRQQEAVLTTFMPEVPGSIKQFCNLVGTAHVDDKTILNLQMGGRSNVENELLCRFTFPERRGSLVQFLDVISPRWNISLFHYRSQGETGANVLIGIQVPSNELNEFRCSANDLGYDYEIESDNEGFQLLMR
ncbi:threonine dehydratase biosynthetic, chloroplastic-like protein [Tanacetum coccineum]|uniref:threonine ammonia-lyase n=1 Tax=Tanacetum coccineum TaxID=301880 RepID=A0ABQ5EWI2_9ASTR